MTRPTTENEVDAAYERRQRIATGESDESVYGHHSDCLVTNAVIVGRRMRDDTDLIADAYTALRERHDRLVRVCRDFADKARFYPSEWHESGVVAALAAEPQEQAKP
jgi:hypothetical protein